MSIHDFKININSADGVNQDSTGRSQFSHLKYNYDFTPHKKGYYELTFTYVGDVNNTFAVANAPYYAMNLGINFSFLNNKRVKENNFSTSQIVGFCNPVIINEANELGYLYADKNTNYPVILQLPFSNGFTVHTLFTDDFSTHWEDGNGNENAGYNLSLYFKYIQPIEEIGYNSFESKPFKSPFN